MKKTGVFIVISLMLVGIVSAGITTMAIDNSTGNDKSNQPSLENPNLIEPPEEENPSSVSSPEQEKERIRDKIQDRLRNRLNDTQIRELIQEKNRLKIHAGNETCPTKCTCTGSAVKCEFANGTREMTITAGKSGNVIIQAKGVDAPTQVTLYKADDGKIYAVTKNNETKEIRMLPDQVRERIKNRIKTRLENENITLDENGTYRYSAEKKAKLFGLFGVKMRVSAKVNSETGETENIKQPWWAFLAKSEEELIVGGCGTVTPGDNDECCKNKCYDVWDAEAGECKFVSG